MEVGTQVMTLSPQAQDDYQWIRRAVNGDQKAYAVLLERYRQPILRIVRRMVQNDEDAEDLTIEAFGKAFRNLGNYSPDFAFSTWLYRIAVNNCIDYIRKRRIFFYSLDDSGAGDEHGESFQDLLRCRALNPEELVVHRQRLQIMRLLLGQLSEKYRLMIELRYFEELSYEEIANVLNIPLGTVKAQLFRAKELLFELLQKPGASAYFETTRKRSRKER